MTMLVIPRPAIMPEPWLEVLRRDPDTAMDDLLCGYAHLPGLQRARQSDALMALLGDLPDNAPERQQADQSLRRWLQIRFGESERFLDRPGKLRRFVDEVTEAIWAAWQLPLPASCQWLAAEFLALLPQAEAFTLDNAHDLVAALLAFTANTQQGEGYRLFWLRMCRDAAVPRRRQRLSIAFLGLARLSSDRPADRVLDGFAQWAAALPADEREKPDVIREWRALKAIYPHQPAYWRHRWQDMVERQTSHPFTAWLQDSDPALKIPPKGTAPKRQPLLPPNVKGMIAEFSNRVAAQGLRPEFFQPMLTLLDQLRRYADTTGESYYLVTSCTNIAKTILPHAPDRALALAREANLWSPGDGHGWSLRAQALLGLGRADLAEAVLWEGRRRDPANVVFYSQLAHLLYRREAYAEAEHLLRQQRELSAGDRKSQSVALYELASFQIARNQPTEAAILAADYAQCLGQDHNTHLLTRLLADGDMGTQEAHDHWRAALPPAPRHDPNPVALPAEEADARHLAPVAAISRLDLTLHLPEPVGQQAAQQELDQILRTNPGNAYAHLVQGLAVPEYCQSLPYHHFPSALPVQLLHPAADWTTLAEEFSDQRPLIDLIRLTRHQADDGLSARLLDWTASTPRWDDGWGGHLRQRVRAYLSDGTALPPDLIHDALIQALDGTWLAPQAA